MVSALRRQDAISRREFPLRNDSLHANSVLRQRLLQDRLPTSRILYIDRDEIPATVAQALNDQANVSYDLQFAPLINDATTSRPLNIIPAGAESDDDNSTSSGISDLDNPTARIPIGLLRAFGRNGEILRVDRQVPATPLRSLSPFDYPSPSYSPVPLEDILGDFPYDASPTPISTASEELDDEAINEILDYLNSDEFLDSIEEL